MALRISRSLLPLVALSIASCGGGDTSPSTTGTSTETTTSSGSGTTDTLPGPEHPNFVLILGEARGWTSTSVLEDTDVPDSKSAIFETPTLDGLAADGLTFADFYAPSPRCMPSRASYLTGKSPAQLHMTFIPEGNKDGQVAGNVVPPITVTDLPTTHLTVGALLKGVGYRTAHFGKWHAGQTDPSMYGFDQSDGPTTNKGPSGEDHPNPTQAYATADRGVDFMKASVAAGTPFYLQISHYGGGDPVDSLPDTYAAESARLAGQDPKDIADAAIIRDMDTTIATVLQALEDLGIAGNTYVFFTADHGRAGTSANPPLKMGKGTVWEGGIRVPLFVRGPGVAKGVHTHVRATQVDLFPTIAALAHAPGPLPDGLEGGSLTGVLATATGSVERPREEFVVHFPHYDKDPLGPASAILFGDFKLVRYYEDGSLHLFNLAQDLGEDNDLAATAPGQAAELDQRMTDYLTAVGAQIPGHK